MLLDNGVIHKAKRLLLPDNIFLPFIPPCTPQLNPAENIWWKMKRRFTGKLHKTLDKIGSDKRSKNN